MSCSGDALWAGQTQLRGILALCWCWKPSHAALCLSCALRRQEPFPPVVAGAWRQPQLRPVREEPSSLLCCRLGVVRSGASWQRLLLDPGLPAAASPLPERGPCPAVSGGALFRVAPLPCPRPLSSGRALRERVTSPAPRRKSAGGALCRGRGALRLPVRPRGARSGAGAGSRSLSARGRGGPGPQPPGPMGRGAGR